MSVKAEELESKHEESDADDGDDEDVLNLMAQEEGYVTIVYYSRQFFRLIKRN